MEESPFEIFIHSKQSSSIALSLNIYVAIHISASIIFSYGHHNINFSQKFSRKFFALKKQKFSSLVLLYVTFPVSFAGSHMVERGFGYPKASTQHSKTPKGVVAISQPSSISKYFRHFFSLFLACSSS